MARIRANVGERIFNISRWHGVNEAPEGEAALKLGEAAEMRNFCVTSGGALKKRPGSKNVAGLLSRYTAHVKKGDPKLLMTDVGGSQEYLMYPRMAADDVGTVRCAGEAVTVSGSSAGEYLGYFLERDGACWELERCERRGAAGGEPITGGSAVPGTLTRVASGAVETGDGGESYTGTRYLETYREAYIESDGSGETVTGVRGQTDRREAPAGHTPGWDSENVGGYFMRNGKLWKYYGARVDSYSAYYRWEKYSCRAVGRGHTYYEEGGWSYRSSSELKAGYELSAYETYTFDEANGTYKLAGSVKSVAAGESGVLYGGARVNISRMVISNLGNGSSLVEYYEPIVRGPFSYTTLEYERGGYLEDVSVRDGDRPGDDEGYKYVAQFDYSGRSYTVMRDGSTYYCYAKASEVPERYRCSYSFHAYPMETSPDTYMWYFNGTYSEAGEAADTQVRGLWSGFVGGREVLCAACGGALWELLEEDGVWSKVSAGEMDTSRDVHMFGFDEKLYILTGENYLVWDGERLSQVEGYRPLVAVSVPPEGGGTLLENVNRLTPGRRCRFSPDGEAKTFKLPEEDIASVDWARIPDTETPAGSFSADLKAGTVTFDSAPPRGINSVEIAWSAKEDLRGQVVAMRFSETYNGAQDTRVFIYGDGSNKALYSGLDYNGRPRADYFPDMYEIAVGDANTPLTAMIRHYNKLMAFKLDSAWSIGYDTITLVDGTVTAGFYVAPVNRSIGSCAWGQARLVQNRPRTLDGRSVIEWRATGSGGITGDERNAERVSQRVDNSIRKFDLTRAKTFYDKFTHEYYVIGEDGTAIAQNMDVDAWYVYTGLDVTSMINYRDELYYGTRDGYLRHFSDRYFSDNGEAIDAYWESGAMSFNEDFRRKYSAMVWVGIKPEDNGYLEVTAQTDRSSQFAVYEVETLDAAGVPEMERIKLKAKKFTYYKLILRSNTADRTVTVVSADIRVRGTGYVR